MVAQTWTPRLETKNEMGEDHLTLLAPLLSQFYIFITGFIQLVPPCPTERCEQGEVAGSARGAGRRRFTGAPRPRLHSGLALPGYAYTLPTPPLRIPLSLPIASFRNSFCLPGLFLPPDAVMGLLEKAEEVFTLLQETTKRLQTVMDHNPRLKAHLEVEASKRTGGRRGF